jgi:YVTN family beta-propeller protein
VLFTDIVGSTERAVELGDRRWKVLLGAHHRVVRKALRRNRGHEVDTAGDGFFATFDQPADAVRAAAELIEVLHRAGIEIRAGIHMGEVERMGPKVGGIAVHIGARVASKAGPGEIIVSGTLRDLVAGSDIRFADRGVETLKGVPGEWRLYSVTDAGVQVAEPEEPSPLEPKQASRNRVILSAIAVVVLGAIVVVALTRGGGAAGTKAGPNTVVRIDPSNGKVLGAAEAGSRPTGITSGAGSLWVVNDADRTLNRIDPASGKVVQTRSVGGTPTGVAFGDGSVWVAIFGETLGGEAAVLRFNPGSTSDAPKVIRVPNGIRSIAFGAGSVWVTNKNQNSVIRIDPSTDSVAQTFSVGKAPEGIAVTDDAVWVANGIDETVWRLDPRTGNVVARIQVLTEPTTVAAGAGSVWVVSAIGNTVVRIDPATNGIVTTIKLGTSPMGAAIGAGALWVGTLGDRTLWRIDPSRNTARAFARFSSGVDAVLVDKGVVWITLHEP